MKSMNLQKLTARRWQAFFTGILISIVAAGTINCVLAARGSAPEQPKPLVKTTPPKASATREVAVLSGGCFWSEEALFE